MGRVNHETNPSPAVSGNFRLVLVSAITMAWLLLSLAGGRVYFAIDDPFFIERTMDRSFLDNLLHRGDLEHFEKFLFRPLSQDLYYRSFQGVFGLNPLPYHLGNSLLLAAVIALVIGLARRVSGSLDAGLWAALLYAVAGLNFRLYTYICNFQEIAMTVGGLLAALMFLRSLDPGARPSARALGPVSFGLALFCKESIIWLPVWLWLYDWIQSGERCLLGFIRSALVRHLPYDLTLAGYLALRLAIVPLPPSEGIFAVGLWGPHLPTRLGEYLHDLVSALGAPSLGRNSIFYIFLCPFVVLAAGWFWLRGKARRAELAAGLGWCALGLLPLLPLKHRSDEYLASLAAVGFFWVVGAGWSRLLPRLPGWAGTLALALVVSVNGHRHWRGYAEQEFVGSARQLRLLHRGLKAAHPEIPPGARVVLVVNPESNLSPRYLGLRALYRRPDLGVVRADEVMDFWPAPNGFPFRPRPGEDYSHSIIIGITPEGMSEFQVTDEGLRPR